MGALDKFEFTGAVKLKIKPWMYLISWGHGGWDSFGLLTYMGVPDPSLVSLGQVISMAKWLPLCIAKQ